MACRACLSSLSLVLSVFLSCGRDRPNLDSVPPSPPSPFTSTVCRSYPSRNPRLAPAPVLVLVWFGCSPAVPVPQSQSIFDCISLTLSSSRRPNPRLLSPMRQSSNTFETDPGKRRHTLLNNLPSSQAFSRPTTAEVSLSPGSVDQLALVALQSCRLLRCG